jgi:hypothetical protein
VVTGGGLKAWRLPEGVGIRELLGTGLWWTRSGNWWVLTGSRVGEMEYGTQMS